MKPITKAVAIAGFFIAAAVGVAPSAIAQSSIQRASEPYVAKPEIKFVLAATEGATPAAPGSAALVAVTPVTPPAPAQAALTSTTTYSVARSDRTHREVLVKWARASGWTFEPEHWAVARDIPVAGVASVDTDFKTAVRMLLRSTELTDLPVQPCFYNPNRTLRVVPINDSCTRGN